MANLIMATASGEQHGLINTLTNSNTFDDFKHMTPENKAKVQKEKKEDSRIVKARYINHRGRHERLTKPYCRYSGDPIQIWHLIPGHEYDLPMGFIKEVNGTYVPPKRSGLQEVDNTPINSDGSPLQSDLKGDRLHELVPTSF